MAKQLPLGGLSSEYDPRFLRRACLIPAPLFPLWYLLGPEGANDPWFVWWLVAGCFVFAGLLPDRPFVRTHLSTIWSGLGWLTTAHFFVLAFRNDMNAFYTVASFVVVVVNAGFQRSRRALLSYATFVGVLGVVLFALDPSSSKLIWTPLAVVFWFDYQWLGRQIAAAELVSKYQAELEARVAERTRELSQTNETLLRTLDERASLEEQLRFSQKMEAVGRLAGGVAHDFNNLLTAIRGYGDLVLDALAEDHPARADVREMEDAANRAAALTRQLLAFSRKGAVETSVLDPEEEIRRMQPMLQTVMGEDVEVVLSFEGGPHRIRGSRVQIEQVILNLALNARDAMPEGGKFVLETSAVAKGSTLPDGLTGSEYVLVAVSDTGSGMDEHTRLRVFEPFFTTKDVDKGTGMGLATVYGIVKQACGTVRVLSGKGAGSRFELYWPAVKGAVDVVEEEFPRASHRGSERILLVEDDDAVRRLAHRVLEGKGYTVIEASDPETALRIALERIQTIDLVVTDVVMPKMSGFELAEKLATERPATRVLFLSGHLEHPSLKSRRLPPGTRLLPKPFSPADLTTEVRAVLDGGE